MQQNDFPARLNNLYSVCSPMLSQREKGVFQCVNIAILLLGHGYLNPHIYKLAIISLSPGIPLVKKLQL